MAIRLKNKFSYKDKLYSYYKSLILHNYNNVNINERTVELPIIHKLYINSLNLRILEVGNVLKHYYRNLHHDVLDKYEHDKNVINEDIADFKPNKKYDMIFSISTLEHIGFDEQIKDDNKLLRALQNIRDNVLTENGIMYFTMPIGYNPFADKLIKENFFNEQIYFEKLNKNKYQECMYNEIKDCKYNFPFRFANALVIGKMAN